MDFYLPKSMENSLPLTFSDLCDVISHHTPHEAC